jgi:hypothetical protein
VDITGEKEEEEDVNIQSTRVGKIISCGILASLTYNPTIMEDPCTMCS